MLITRHFVLVHQQKTGGVFIKNLFTAHLPDWIIESSDDHPPARDIPAEYRDLPVLGFVRNPWDWYVSWYHFVLDQSERLKDQPPGPWTVIFDRGRASFKEAITAACSGVPVAGQPAPVWMDRMRAQRVDLYSSWCAQVFRAGFDGTVEMGRFETLREDFIGFLERHAIPVGDDFIARVLTRPPDNVGRHRPYASYYDAELRDLVGATSRVAREYGYTFEG